MTSHSFKEHDRVVKVVLTHEDAKLPGYAKHGDAGADVYAVPRVQKYSDEERGRLAFVEPRDEKMKDAYYKDGDYIIQPRATVMIDLGICIELRDGWEMQVRSRSGMSQHGLVVANAPGTIDSGYRGPCKVLLHNNTKFTRIIRPGTRVAQFVLKRAPQAVFREVAELSSSERGKDGFGSTGTK